MDAPLAKPDLTSFILKASPPPAEPAFRCAALRCAALEPLKIKASGDVNSGLGSGRYQIKHQIRAADRTTHPGMYNLVFSFRPPLVRNSTKFDNV